MFERICLILLTTFVFFFKTLRYNYCSDDLPAHMNPPKYKNKIEKWYWQIEGALKFRADEDHFISLIVHALVCVFIYISFGANDVSFLAALLFCVNPINNQCSVWISGRGYSMPTLFLLMAMVMPLLSPILMLGAVYFNPGFFMPIVFAGSNVWILTLLLPLAWHFHHKRFRKQVDHKIKTEMFGHDKKITISKLVVAIKTFGFYIFNSLIPFKTTFYHSFMQSLAGNDIMRKRAYSLNFFFWFGSACIVSVLAYWFTQPWDMISFAMLWFCIGIAPFSNLVRMSQEIAERYVYMPNCGLMFILASVLVHYPALSSAWIAMYATKMWFYMDSFEDEYYLVESACLSSRDAWFAWHIRAMKRWDTQSFREALILWTMAKAISPKEFKVLFNIATCLKLGRNEKEAEEHIRLAQDNIPLGQEIEALKLIDEWRKGKLAVLI